MNSTSFFLLILQFWVKFYDSLSLDVQAQNGTVHSNSKLSRVLAPELPRVFLILLGAVFILTYCQE